MPKRTLRSLRKQLDVFGAQSLDELTAEKYRLRRRTTVGLSAVAVCASPVSCRVGQDLFRSDCETETSGAKGS